MLAVKFNLHRTTISKQDVELSKFYAKCALCNFTTTKVFIMERHVNKEHEESKPYECKDCHESYYDKHAWNSHLKKAHDGRLPPSVRRARNVQRGNQLHHCDCCGKYYKRSALRRHREGAVSLSIFLIFLPLPFLKGTTTGEIIKYLV